MLHIRTMIADKKYQGSGIAFEFAKTAIFSTAGFGELERDEGRAQGNHSGRSECHVVKLVFWESLKDFFEGF
jgi:hypothetical protein